MVTFSFLTLIFFHIGGSDFTISKGAFGKVTLLEIDNMGIVVACQAVSATLKDVKAEIYAIEHKVYSGK